MTITLKMVKSDSKLIISDTLCTNDNIGNKILICFPEKNYYFVVKDQKIRNVIHVIESISLKCTTYIFMGHEAQKILK